MVHILHLEDNAVDAELVQATLQLGGMACQITRVQTGDEFGQAVRRDGYDLILADYSLPGYNGMAALRLAQQECPDVPFIFVSGTLGEDAAIEGLTQGATDYVVKQKLARLAPASQRALRDAHNRRERKRAEEALRAKTEELDRYFTASLDLLCIADTDGYFHRLNPEWEKTLGYALAELEGRRFLDLVHPDDLQATLAAMSQLENQDSVLNFENRYRCKDGSYRWIEWRSIPIGKLIYAAARDVTERKRAEEQIRKALAEKETLLRELYHRTKNNMQVIISLLKLQAAGVADARLQAILKDTQNRIHSMALVHQKLYEAQDLSRVNLKEYIGDLIRFLMASCQVPPDKLSVVLEMDDVFVLIDSAIPCGLILSELISNSLKHAFPADRAGEIRVHLSRGESGEIWLRVADNGVGAPRGFDFRRDGRLGLQNIFALGERQLKGQVIFDVEQGVACQIRFKDDLYAPRV